MNRRSVPDSLPVLAHGTGAESPDRQLPGRTAGAFW